MDTHFAAQSGRVKVWFTRPLRFVACGSGLFVLFTLPVAAQTNPLVVSTVAGLANFGSADGIGSAAKFLLPAGVAVDGAGNVYVADADNDTIRKVTSAGVVTTLAGTAQMSGTNDGTGSAALFNHPYGVAVDSVGNVYVADSYNQTIRQDHKQRRGNDDCGTGRHCRVQQWIRRDKHGALFSYPYGMAVDGSSNIYVADTDNNMIRMIANGSNVMTLAGGLASGINNGTGTNAQFHEPLARGGRQRGKCLCGGHVQLPHSPHHARGCGDESGRVEASGHVAEPTRVLLPHRVAVDSATNVYVADYGNQVIRVIPRTNGSCSTLAGELGLYGDGDGFYPQATFYISVGGGGGQRDECVCGRFRQWQYSKNYTAPPMCFRRWLVLTKATG